MVDIKNDINKQDFNIANKLSSYIKILIPIFISMIYVYYTFEKNKYIVPHVLKEQSSLLISYMYMSRYIIPFSVIISIIFTYILAKTLTKHTFLSFMMKYLNITILVWFICIIYASAIGQSIADSGIPNTHLSNPINKLIFYFCVILSYRWLMFLVFFSGITSLIFLNNTKLKFNTSNLSHQGKLLMVITFLLFIVFIAPFLKIILTLPYQTRDYITIF